MGRETFSRVWIGKTEPMDEGSPAQPLPTREAEPTRLTSLENDPLPLSPVAMGYAACYGPSYFSGRYGSTRFFNWSNGFGPIQPSCTTPFVSITNVDGVASI